MLVGTYLWHVNEPDAWYRAAAPVAAIVLFRSLDPVIRRAWFQYQRRKLNRELSRET